MACAMPPDSIDAARAALAGAAPRRRASAAARSRWIRSSCSRSRSFLAGWRVPQRRLIHSRNVAIGFTFVSSLLAEEGVDDGRHAIPLRLLGGECAPSVSGDRVEPRLPIVVGDA